VFCSTRNAASISSKRSSSMPGSSSSTHPLRKKSGSVSLAVPDPRSSFISLRPNSQHKLFNLTVVVPPEDPEEPLLAPAPAPGVCYAPVLDSSFLPPTHKSDCCVSGDLWSCEVGLSVHPTRVHKEICVDLEERLYWALVHDLIHDILLPPPGLRKCVGSANSVGGLSFIGMAFRVITLGFLV